MADAKTWPDRVWAVEGANGAGRPLAQWLLEAGEQVVDVPAKLAARVRLFDTGHNRQNADDVSGATTVRFSVEADSLTVRNDGVFTNCGQQHEDKLPMEERTRSQLRLALVPTLVWTPQEP